MTEEPDEAVVRASLVARMQRAFARMRGERNERFRRVVETTRQMLDELDEQERGKK